MQKFQIPAVLDGISGEFHFEFEPLSKGKCINHSVSHNENEH